MDDQEYNGLTLEGLAQRLEALERENEQMRSENAELRDEVAALSGSGTGPAEEEFAASFEGPPPSSMQPELTARRYSDTGRLPAQASEFDGQASSSRWSLLRNAGAAALGSVVAGAVTQRDIGEAKAADIFGSLLRNAGGAALGIVAAEGLTQQDIREARINGNFDSLQCYHLYCLISARFNWMTCNRLNCLEIHASTDTGPVVFVHSANGDGVLGHGTGSTYAGVRGRNPSGIGVRGEGKLGGVSGDGPTGVAGHTTARGGYGVRGEGSAIGTGVFGRSLGNGFSGVHGVGLNLGYGGTFRGGKAQLRLIPGGDAGEPTGAHEKGEIYLDADATLWICEASGNPATWRAV